MNILDWIKKKYNKKKMKFKRTKLFKFIENIVIFGIIKTKFKRLPSSLEGHYPILTEKAFYKIATKNLCFFEYEKDSINFLKTNYPEIAKLIPDYEYHNNYFKTEILEPISDIKEQLDSAKNILNIFKIYGEKNQINLNDLYHIIDGLNIINYLMGEDKYSKIKKKVEDILENNKFRIGICHGDFHSKNIVKKDSDIFIIDFDCLRKKSIQEFDIIYFMIQYIIYIDRNIWWYEALLKFDEQIEKHLEYKLFLEEFVSFDKIKELKLLYFLDRIGQDAKYFKNYDALPSTDIIETLNRIGFNDD